MFKMQLRELHFYPRMPKQAFSYVWLQKDVQYTCTRNHKWTTNICRQIYNNLLLDMHRFPLHCTCDLCDISRLKGKYGFGSFWRGQIIFPFILLLEFECVYHSGLHRIPRHFSSNSLWFINCEMWSCEAVIWFDNKARSRKHNPL